MKLEMKNSKGINADLAVMLLTLLTVGMASVTFTMTQDLIGDSSQDNTDQIPFTDSGLEVEIISRNDDFLSKFVRVENYDESSGNLSFRVDETEINNQFTRPEENYQFTPTCLKTTNETFQVRGNGIEKDIDLDIDAGYCIEINRTEIEYQGSDTYRRWYAVAYQNNEEETPYSNGEVLIETDKDSNSKSTDSEGRFNFTNRWDLTYIEPNSFWSTKEVYTDSDRYQPPNRVGLEYEGDNSQYFQDTQLARYEGDSNNAEVSYDITPLNVRDNEIEFNVNIDVTALQGMSDDWNNQNGRMMYQIPFKESGNYVNIANLECSASADVSCETSTVQVEMSSEIANQSLERSNLPTDGSGNKYIPIDRKVEANGNDLLVGLNSYDEYKHGSGHRRISHHKHLSLIPEGESKQFYQNYTLNYLDSVVDGNIERAYRSRRGLVPTANGWGASPYFARNNIHFDLEDDHTKSSASDQGDVETVLYEWNDVNQGETYNLNFNISVERDSSNNKVFRLPTHLGIFGMFPQDGGKAISSGSRYNGYTRNQVRNPDPLRNRPNIDITIPYQGYDQAMVYKLANKDSSDQWTTETFILNTAQRNITSIYLLDSRGEWENIIGNVGGGAYPNPGDTFEYDFDLDRDTTDELTQVNLRYQSIDFSTSEPAYNGWPYQYNLTVNGEDDSYDYDLSGFINCNYRYCNSYRSSNRDIARPIDSLRGGNSAGTSIFNENIERINLSIKNNEDDSDTGTQDFRRFRFWIWYLDPTTANLEDQLERPEYLRIETTNNNYLKKGLYEEEFAQ